MSTVLNGDGDGTTNGVDIDENVNSIYTASSVSEIRASLAELSQREATVTSRLDQLLATQQDFTRTLSRLDLARAHLGTQLLATRQLSNGMLSAASTTASRISRAVKRLDHEQAAVKSTLAVVEQVAELKACVLGVAGSMEGAQDWETAASYLQRARNVPRSVLESKFAEESVPTAEVPDPPAVTLENASESLCGLFLREFEKAAREGDGAGVTRFFKLFPLIGRETVGLDAYGRYVCTGIASRARSTLNSSGGRSREGGQLGMFYANALTKLFEHIAQIVDGHEALVERHYGQGSMVKVVERIQVEADVQGGLILDSWAEERRVGRRLTDVRSYPFNFLVQSFLPASKAGALGSTPRTGSPAPGGSGEDDAVDMKEIDALLNESALMLGRWSLYTRFLASKTAIAPTPDANEDPEKLHLPPFLTDSSLHRKVTSTLIEPFNLMSTFFFRRSVEKSFQLDEAPSGLHLQHNKALPGSPPYITSAVDDVMYIVNQVLQKTLATNQKAVVASVVPSIGRVLGSDFFGMIQRKMRDESYPKAAIQGAFPPESLIVGFLVLINNLDVATEYVQRIFSSSLGGQQPNTTENGAASPLAATFPFGNEAVYVSKALHSMQSAFEAKTGDLIAEAIEVMLKQVIRPRLRPVLIDTFKDIDYSDFQDDDTATAADEEADQGDSDNKIVPQRFEKGWQAFTLPLKRILTPTAFSLLHTSTCAYLARTLEKRIWSYGSGAGHGNGGISALGAVRLERDLAGIIAAAVKGASRYELRDVFARCAQVTLVLNMEADEWEEIESLGARAAEVERVSGVQWRLDEGERGRVRGLLIARR